jgi:large subunit ribosomal protein L4
MSYTITIYDQQGKSVGTKKLSADLYADDVINNDLIHEYVLLQQANARVAIAHTKTRGEVRSSGRKLYKQKGTGNARVGDVASPIRVGGGVAFGPRKERNFSKSMSKKMRRKAMCGIISQRAKDKDILALASFDTKAPKTKEAVQFLQAAKLDQQKILLVVGNRDENLEKSFANIPSVKQVRVQYLNPVDMLQAHKIVFMEECLDVINTTA